MAVDEFTPEELEAEEWRPIPDATAYSVSSLGRIRRPDKTLTTGFLSNGYRSVSINNRQRRVHSAVCLAFMGERPAGNNINHIDAVKTNNRASNLEYVTPAQNSSHAARLGLIQSGDSHWSRRHPEKVRTGTSHWMHKKPELRLTGDRHWSRKHPGRIARGDRHSSKTHPERVVRGTRHGSAKLTESDVISIRLRVIAGELQSALANEFGVSPAAVHKIVVRETWTHV